MNIDSETRFPELLWLQPSAGILWTDSGTAMMIAVLRRFQRRRFAHAELTSSSIKGGRPSLHGLPAPQSLVSLFKFSVGRNILIGWKTPKKADLCPAKGLIPMSITDCGTFPPPSLLPQAPPAHPPLTTGWSGWWGAVRGAVWYQEDPALSHRGPRRPQSLLSCQCLETNPRKL